MAEELEVEYSVSGQKALNGHYDGNFILRKAKKDLARSMSSVHNFHEAAIDFSSSINHMADWVWRVHIKGEGRWLGQKHKSYIDFIVAESFPCAVLMDLCNEFKHANRTIPSKHLSGLFLIPFFEGYTAPYDHSYDVMAIHQRVGRDSDRIVPFVPVFETSGGRHFYKKTGDLAIGWWESELKNYPLRKDDKTV